MSTEGIFQEPRYDLVNNNKIRINKQQLSAGILISISCNVKSVPLATCNSCCFQETNFDTLFLHRHHVLNKPHMPPVCVPHQQILHQKDAFSGSNPFSRQH